MTWYDMRQRGIRVHPGGLSPVACGGDDFGGVRRAPGSGNSGLARRVADAIGATYLRIGTIEWAIASTLMPYRDNPGGLRRCRAGSRPASSRQAGTWWPMR